MVGDAKLRTKEIRASTPLRLSPRRIKKFKKKKKLIPTRRIIGLFAIDNSLLRTRDWGRKIGSQPPTQTQTNKKKKKKKKEILSAKFLFIFQNKVLL